MLIEIKDLDRQVRAIVARKAAEKGLTIKPPVIVAQTAPRGDAAAFTAYMAWLNGEVR